MSRLSGYVVIFAFATMPAAARAQQDLALLARRADSSHGVAVATQQALSAYRAAHPPHFAFDDSLSIATGKVKVFFNAATAGLARAAADEAAKSLDNLGSALGQLPTYLVAVVPDSATTPSVEEPGVVGRVNVEYYLSTGQRTPFRTSTEAEPKAVAEVIVSTVGNKAGATLAPEVEQWLTGHIPMSPPLATTLDWGELRLSMVSSPSRVGRECFMGDLRACKLYLGLDSVADPARSLFDSTGRRLLVDYDAGRMRYVSRDNYTRCVNGNDQACVALIEIGGTGPLSSPYARASLLTEALDRGGPRALERLMSSSGTAGAALAAAANEPLDSLVADWQHHVNERFGTSANVPLSIVLSSLAGIGICVFLALRSSRWR